VHTHTCEPVLIPSPMNPTTATRQLSTAEERRADVLPVAARAFAQGGLHGTPTAEIAKDSGISQAYLFRLFPTKLELFVAVVDRCFALTLARFREAASEAGGAGDDILCALGDAYVGMLADRELLLVQLHGHAAAATEPAVRDAVRRGFAQLFDYARAVSGGSDEEIRDWFAQGMLLNVLAAMDAQHVEEPWTHALVAKPTTH
jgi:AcrR family transcriptional regulator